MIRVIFVISEPEILYFLTISILIGKSEKNVLAGVHKEFERCQTYRNVLTTIIGTRWKQNGIVPR